MRLTDSTQGLTGSELEHVELEGFGLSDLGRFWDRSARVDAKKAIASAEDAEGFETSGLRQRDALTQLVRPTDRVLDLGCGIGRVTQHIADLCAELHGVDISQEMISVARERLAGFENVRLHVGNGYDLGGFDTASLDLIYSVLTLQHVPKNVVLNYLKEFQRVLVDGGLIRIGLPNLLRELHFEAFNHFSQPYFAAHPYPMYYYTGIEVVSLLLRTGFSIEAIDDRLMVVARKSAEPSATAEAVAFLHSEVDRVVGGERTNVSGRRRRRRRA